MIAPQDLKIGNYLKLGEVILIVNEINMTGFYAGNEAEGNFKGNVWEIEPIELTEDWIVRMGYTGNEPIFSEKSTIFTKGKHKIWCPFDEFLDDYYRFKIKSVHQLQNLFHSLTGEELILNN